MPTAWVYKRARKGSGAAVPLTTRVNEESNVEFDKSQSVVNQV
jgi:hypothetical protein